MATLVLGAVGSAVGGALLPGGLSLFGATITGAALGGAVGSLAGGVIDQALLGPLAGPSGQTQIVQGPRLFDLKLGASSEGASIPRVYGRARLPGQLIWATRFKEEVKTTTQTTGGGQAGGGKNVLGSQSASQSNKVEIEEYRYFANAAYAICEGPITRIGRIWADGRELNQSNLHDQGPSRRRGANRRRADRGEGRRRRQRRPIAASPMWCSSDCRWSISAIACRSSISRCSARSTISRATCAA